MGLNPPLTKGIIDCIKTLTSYYHLSYDDLFKKQEGDDFLTFYSGTCHPFQTRVFISTPGLIFPCEKVDFETPLGYIDSNNTIVIDFESIAKYYNTLYTCLKKFCPSCIHQFNCQHCFVQDGYFHDGEARCSDYKALNQKNLLELINFVRDHSDLLPLVQRII